ncbi:unnamed protein product [Xylocopa violacea]|uniref:CCHC-type domain-containing protein n=1 Tax=Xylocopa violacea TaxID=135666 RepID=A0ABP1NBC9_XYLVO
MRGGYDDSNDVDFSLVELVSEPETEKRNLEKKKRKRNNKINISQEDSPTKVTPHSKRQEKDDGIGSLGEENKEMRMQEASLEKGDTIKIRWTVCKIREFKLIDGCYRCTGMGHISIDKEVEKRCYECGSEEHLLGACSSVRDQGQRDFRHDDPAVGGVGSPEPGPKFSPGPSPYVNQQQSETIKRNELKLIRERRDDSPVTKEIRWMKLELAEMDKGKGKVMDFMVETGPLRRQENKMVRDVGTQTQRDRIG